MKKLLLVLVTFIAFTHAAEPMVGADLGMKSSYVWRGITLNDEAVFWPDMWLSFGNFTLTAFASIDMTDANEMQGDVNEFDFFTDYAFNIGSVDLGLGYYHYTYPASGVSGEFIFSLYKTVNFFTFGVSTSYDVWDALGLYTLPTVGVAFEKGSLSGGLDIGLGIGGENHNSVNFGVAKSGLTDLTTIGSLTYAIGNHFSATADLGYAYIPDSELAESYEDERSSFWFGFMLSSWFGGNE